MSILILEIFIDCLKRKKLEITKFKTRDEGYKMKIGQNYGELVLNQGKYLL